MGLNNTIRYKRLSLGFNFDFRHGGLMYSATKATLYFTGNAEETMYNLRDPWIYPNSVIQVGKHGAGNPVYAENDRPINSFYNVHGLYNNSNNYSVYRDFLIDKTYVKLRELNISYTLPDKWFENVRWLSSINVSLVGRNLLMWTPKKGLVDPDNTNYGNDLTSQYGEYFSAPSTRTFGGSVKIVF